MDQAHVDLTVTTKDDQPGKESWAARHDRSLILSSAAVIAVLVIIGIQYLLPLSIAIVLIDAETNTYPLTVQNVMWIVFFLGLGEIVIRARAAASEQRELTKRYLPEDETTVLQGPELREIYSVARRLARIDRADNGRFLPRLLLRVVTQFQTNKSVDQASAVLNSSLDLFMHEIDLRYTMIRYVIWAIPALGFLGTVYGIALALAYAGGADLQDPTLLAELTKRLAVAFNTTLLALLMSAVLVFVQHIVQAREETALNRVGQYCLDNLINRLYVE